MPIVIKPTNKGKDKIGGGGMDIGKTPKKKKTNLKSDALKIATLRDPGKLTQKDIDRAKDTIKQVNTKKGGGLASAINRVKRQQGVQGMRRGGLSGGNPSGAPKRMVPDPAISVVNPGKNIDVTLMAKGGYMDEEVEKMMMGGYMAYKDDK